MSANRTMSRVSDGQIKMEEVNNIPAEGTKTLPEDVLNEEKEPLVSENVETENQKAEDDEDDSASSNASSSDLKDQLPDEKDDPPPVEAYPDEPANPELEADDCLLEDGKLDIEKQKAKFLHICKYYIRRDKSGLKQLLDKFCSPQNDFFKAPASAQFHGDYEGGLCQHSIDVWVYARKLNESALFPVKFSEESLCIAALFHDVCKVGLYKKVTKFRKDDKGRWESYEGFVVDEDFHFGGHGSKSVFMVQRSFKLTYEEAVAINCHMGFSDGSPTTIRDVSNAYQQYPLAWLIHVADEAATFLIKRKLPEKPKK